MNTKTKLALLGATLCALQTTPLSASCYLDTKVGAFFLLSSEMRDLYGTVLPSFTLEASVDVYQGLGLWIDGSYLFGNGGNEYGSSHLNLVPLSFGLKYTYSIWDKGDIYAGVGPAYSFLIVRNHSEFLHDKTDSNNWGAVAKSGFIYRCTQHVQIEGYMRYLYQKFHFVGALQDPLVYQTNIFLNGFEAGASVGYSF